MTDDARPIPEELASAILDRLELEDFDEQRDALARFVMEQQAAAVAAKIAKLADAVDNMLAHDTMTGADGIQYVAITAKRNLNSLTARWREATQ